MLMQSCSIRASKKPKSRKTWLVFTDHMSSLEYSSTDAYRELTKVKTERGFNVDAS